MEAFSSSSDEGEWQSRSPESLGVITICSEWFPSCLPFTLFADYDACILTSIIASTASLHPSSFNGIARFCGMIYGCMLEGSIIAVPVECKDGWRSDSRCYLLVTKREENGLTHRLAQTFGNRRFLGDQHSIRGRVGIHHGCRLMGGVDGDGCVGGGGGGGGDGSL